MKKAKIIYIVAAPSTVRNFLVERVHYMSDAYAVSVVCSPGPEHAEYKKQGVAMHAVRIARRLSPLRDIVSLVRLYWLLRVEMPDIVHTMTPKAGLLGMMAAWAARVPVRIAMFNGELNLPGRLTRAIVRVTNALTCFFSTHVNADGFGTREYVVEQKVTRKPITVFWKGNINGIDLERFSCKGKREEMRRRLGIGESTLVYIFVGRLVHDKGIDELVPAFLEMRRRGLDVALVLVGIEEPRLDPLAEGTREAIRSTPDIYAVGLQDNIPDWLEMADVFVLPSHREGCNCSLLEGSSMGLPAVATDIRGCRDIIQNHVNGLLVPAKDTEALCEAMCLLYTQEDLRRQLGERSRALVEANFDRKDVWREMTEFYDRIVAKSFRKRVRE